MTVLHGITREHPAFAEVSPHNRCGSLDFQGCWFFGHLPRRLKQRPAQRPRSTLSGLILSAGWHDSAPRRTHAADLRLEEARLVSGRLQMRSLMLFVAALDGDPARLHCLGNLTH